MVIIRQCKNETKQLTYGDLKEGEFFEFEECDTLRLKANEGYIRFSGTEVYMYEDEDAHTYGYVTIVNAEIHIVE